MMTQLVDWLNNPLVVDYGIIFLTFFVGVFVGVIISENRRR